MLNVGGVANVTYFGDGGGSWADLPQILRSAFRLRGPTDNRYDGLGFRIGRTLSR